MFARFIQYGKKLHWFTIRFSCWELISKYTCRIHVQFDQAKKGPKLQTTGLPSSGLYVLSWVVIEKSIILKQWKEANTDLPTPKRQKSRDSEVRAGKSSIEVGQSCEMSQIS